MGKVLIWGKSAYLGKWRVSHLRHSLYDENTGDLFFWNSPLPKISTFSLVKEECAYFGKCDFFERAYYELGPYF